MQTRRQAIKKSATVAGLLASTGLFPQFAFAAYNTTAFEAKNIPDALKALGVGAPVESKDITVTGPDIAENGAVVPLGVSTTLAGVKRMLIMVEKNPASLTALFNMTDSVESAFSTRTKMGQSSDVYAVAIMGDGKVLFAKKEVKVTLGGCGGTRTVSPYLSFFIQIQEFKMADPMRIRAQAAGDKTTVRVLMAHEMEGGQRKDAAGKIVPAWYIQEVTATHNGKTVLTAEWGPAVSKNPFLQFVVKGAKVGDKIAVNWKDNKGDTRSDEATVS